MSGASALFQHPVWGPSPTQLPADLSNLSMLELGTLTNRLFRELDRISPDPGTRTDYDRIVTELESREAADRIAQGPSRS